MSTDRRSSGQRKAPQQERSREMVAKIVGATAALLRRVEPDQVTTNAIAEKAGVSKGSIYQYFADKEGVLLALAQRDMDEMDTQVAEDLAGVELLSVATLVRTTMAAYVAVYRRRPAFVEIYLRGRTNAAVHRFGREHNVRTAQLLRDLAVDAGLARPDLSPQVAELAVEVGDRVFQLAYEHDEAGDQALVEEGITMVTAYLERYATPAGLTGVAR